MSCQIKICANICDIPKVRRCLFPYDDDKGTDSWLQNCHVSVSPTGELIVIASSSRIVVLSAKWDSTAVLNQYHVTYFGALEDSQDPITAILCLPIAFQNQSSQVGPDWTCIAVGYQSGYLKFYTENCTLLFSERLHDDRICSIKCQSQQHSYIECGSEIHPEELYIQYPMNVCIIGGSQLFTALRNSRSHLARVQAKGVTFDSMPPYLNPKKWGFTDHNVLNDIVVVGSDSVNTFDHLLTASTCGGFNARYRAMAPNNTLVIGVGSSPFVGFHYAIEGGAQPVLSDVAKAVAIKLKSALPNWLTGNKANEEKTPPVSFQPAEPMGCRFGLCDSRRKGESVILSQNKKLSVVTDSLGRISLIDNRLGIVIRLWKGYRGAQCAFLEVPEEERIRSKGHKFVRVALFLIIYTSRKGIIEIWPVQQGSKIATFSASKHSQLVYTNYGLMGLSTVHKMKQVCHFSCLLMDSDGQIKEFIVPFHFILSEKNSQRARDLHLYKRLKQFLKGQECDQDKLCSEVTMTCSELKTPEIQLQCFEMLRSCKHIQPKAMSEMCETFLQKHTNKESTCADTNKLLVLCQKLNLLVNFYLYFENDNCDSENGNIPAAEVEDGDSKAGSTTTTTTELFISEKEMFNLQRLLDLSTLNDIQKNSQPKVSFFVERKSSFYEYISLFQIDETENKIRLKENVAEDKLYRVSEYIFQKFIMSKKNMSDFEIEVTKSNICVVDLIKMILSFWVNRPLDVYINLETEMHNSGKILRAICNTVENISVEYNETSLFWTEIRDILADSAKPFPALTAAILCRSIAQRIEQERERQHGSATSLDDEPSCNDLWEKLSQESCHWNILIGKLEDISLLNIILNNKPIYKNSALPKLFFERNVISLKYVLQKGRGSVSELVSQWLTSAGVDPKDIALNDVCQLGSLEPNTSADILNVVSQPMFEHLNLLRKQFPHSLDLSSVLANMSWEYALAWHKNIQELGLLNSALVCLKHISNEHIKQGLFNMVWTTHIKQVFESSCKLVNKVGKVPKSALCLQDAGLMDTHIPIFIQICSEFLDAFMDAITDNSNEKPNLVFENLWENGGAPLTELALQQPNLNGTLVHLHYQLSIVMQMMTTFAIKQPKPMPSLFDSACFSLFFADFSQKGLVSSFSTDGKLKSTRGQFLIKVITASIETIQVNNDSVYSADHVYWMSKCLILANQWGVDTDLLRRHQVLQVFIGGFNDLGEELLPSVSEVDRLGPELLALAGKQLKRLLSSKSDMMEQLVVLNPSLIKYFDILNSEWCAAGTLDSITRLAEHANRCLPENDSYRKYADLLLDACVALQDKEN